MVTARLRIPAGERRFYAALGHNRLDWMLALGGVMAAERLAPWGQRLGHFEIA